MTTQTVPELTDHQARLLRGLSGFTDYVDSDSAYAAAFGKAACPGVQGASGLLRRLADRGLVKRRISGLRRKWLLADAGRLAWTAMGKQWESRRPERLDSP